MGFVVGPTFPQQLAIRFHYSSNEDNHKDLTRFLAARLWFLGWISRRVKGELIRDYDILMRENEICVGIYNHSFCLATAYFLTQRMKTPPNPPPHTLTCISLLHRPFSQCCSHIWPVPLSLCQGYVVDDLLQYHRVNAHPMFKCHISVFLTTINARGKDARNRWHT